MIELNGTLDRLLQAQIARDWATTETTNVCCESICDKALHLKAVGGGGTIPVGRPRCNFSGAAIYDKMRSAVTLSKGVGKLLANNVPADIRKL